MADEHEIAPAPMLFADQASWAEAVAARLAAGLGAVLQRQPGALLAVAGGSTPAPILAALAARPIDWSRIRIIPTDERQVAPDHPARNDSMIARALGRAVTPLADCPTDRGPDVVLLGFGLDRHVASVFPAGAGMAAARAGEGPSIVATTPEPLPSEAPFARLTFTLPALAGAHTLTIAATGGAKRAAHAAACAERPPVTPLALLLAARLDAAVMLRD